MEDYDSKNDIAKIEIKTSTLNINKINKANIINKSLYSNLNIQPQQNNRYFNNYNNQNFNNNFNELNNGQEV